MLITPLNLWGNKYFLHCIIGSPLLWQQWLWVLRLQSPFYFHSPSKWTDGCICFHARNSLCLTLFSKFLWWSHWYHYLKFILQSPFCFPLTILMDWMPASLVEQVTGEVNLLCLKTTYLSYSSTVLVLNFSSH